MADGDFSEHFVEQVIQIGASGQALQIGSVLLLRGIDVQPVMVWIVQEIALDAPNLVVHLVPFGARVNVNFHLIQFECTVSRLRRGVRLGDEPPLPLAVQHFFAIRGNSQSVDSAEERLRFACRQIKL